MTTVLIKNACIINEGERFEGGILIRDRHIERIYRGAIPEDVSAGLIVDAKGKLMIPGVIDDQVHFREPGLTHKADIYHESRAALAGGVTSFMDMPNTSPPATTIELLEDKYRLGEQHSAINYSFYFGATNTNAEELRRIDPKRVCGVKVFMGSSTGNMLVDEEDALRSIFASSPILIATHCEDEGIVRANTSAYKERYGEDIPFACHPLIRSREACYKSSARAVELAKRYNARLHVLHLSTADELALFEPYKELRLEDKRITAEVCVHHLWYCDEDYGQMGARIKCNPAIKSANDRSALLEAVKNGTIDVVATDHAPHTVEEKQQKYLSAPSGLPLVQYSLVAMLEFFHQNKLSLETIVQRMCHNPSRLFNIHKRGFIREGYFADIAIVDLKKPTIVDKESILSKCGWSPFEGYTFQSSVTHTFVNGLLAYNEGAIMPDARGERLLFDR